MINVLIYEITNAPPEKIALIIGDKTVTYNALNKKIASYSYYLKEKGIKPGDRVGLLCQNSPEFIYSYFALALLGAKVVPLNLVFTVDEIMYILHDSEAVALIIHSKVLQKLKNASGIIIEKTFEINESFFEELPEKHFEHPINISENELCTILYTSGTTGKPKGAMLSHKNLISNAISTNEVFKVTEQDNFICVLPMFHSFAFTCCILTPLYAGGSITIQETFSPKETLNVIKESKVTVFCGVPVMYNFINQTSDKDSLKSVRLAVSGGAPLPVEVLENFENKFHIPLIEGYGLSEASPVVSFNPIGAGRKKASIGTAIPGVKVKIFDEKGIEIPQGQIGEIVVQGDNVMTGYLNLPTETTQALKDGWLFTGDVGYIDEEGFIFIVDRKKDLVIVGGLNVYPREVEEIIYTYPGVMECAVIGIPDITRGELVKAYVVNKEGFTVDKKSLLKHLKEHLAIYKLPKTIDFISAIPKTGTGKVDKKVLRKLALEE